MADLFSKTRPTPSNWFGYTAPRTILPKGPWNGERAILQGLQVCSWVYACIDMRAKGLSSVPWIVQRRVGRAANARKWERDYTHPIETLLERPNKTMSRKFLMHFQSMHLDTGGNALFQKLKAGGQYRELWPLNPSRAEPVVDATGTMVGAYRLMAYQNIIQQGGVGSGVFDVPADQVIHAQRPNPINPYWGMSPLQTLAGTVDMDVSMVATNRKLAANNNMPAAIISDQNIKTTGQLIEAQDALDQRWSSDQSGKPMVLPAGTALLRMALTPQEMDYLQSREWNVKEICAPFDVLPALFEPTAATYSNLSASIEYMWEAGIIPQLDVLRDAMNLGLLTREESLSTYITYDLADIKALKVQFTRAVADFRTLVTTGVPGAIANDRTNIGLPKYTNDDVSYPPAQGGVDAQGNPVSAPVSIAGNATGKETGVGLMPGGGDPGALSTPNSPSTSTPNQSGKSLDDVVSTVESLLMQAPTLVKLAGAN